jgi:hypothetical protein
MLFYSMVRIWWNRLTKVEQINKGKFGSIEWVLNLELTGKVVSIFFYR